MKRNYLQFKSELKSELGINNNIIVDDPLNQNINLNKSNTNYFLCENSYFSFEDNLDQKRK